MSVRLGDTAPDFTADTTQGTINFHEWVGDGWAILFSHPKDFTPVCTTELGYMASLAPEFAKRNTKVLGLSVDPVGNHERWSKDIEETQGTAVNFPMIGDPDRTVADHHRHVLQRSTGESVDERLCPLDDDSTVGTLDNDGVVDGRELGWDDGCDVGQSDTEGCSEGGTLGPALADGDTDCASVGLPL